MPTTEPGTVSAPAATHGAAACPAARTPGLPDGRPAPVALVWRIRPADRCPQDRSARSPVMSSSGGLGVEPDRRVHGYDCFGQVGFFGLGEVPTVVMMAHGHLSFWLSWTAAAGTGPGCRLRLVRLADAAAGGKYFAVATWESTKAARGRGV